MERRSFLGGCLASSLSPLVSFNGLPPAMGGAGMPDVAAMPLAQSETVRLLMPRWKMFAGDSDHDWFSVAGLCTENATAEAIFAHDEKYHCKLHDKRIVEFDARFPGRRFLDVCIRRPRSFFPVNVLEIPPLVETDDFEIVKDISGEQAFEHFHTTREAAFADVAKWNEEFMDEVDGAPDYWNVCLEFGDAIPDKGFVNCTLTGEYGVADFHIERPIRLIRPTPEEIERFASREWEWNSNDDGGEGGGN